MLINIPRAALLLLMQTFALNSTPVQRPPKMLVHVLSGAEALGAMLSRQARWSTSPLLSPALWLEWSVAVVKRKLLTDVEFANRVFCRDLRKANYPALHQLEHLEREAELNYEKSAQFEEIEMLDRSIRGAEQAVSSMELFVRSTIVVGTSVKIEKAEKMRKIKDELLPLKIRDLTASLARRDELRLACKEYSTVVAQRLAVSEFSDKIGLSEAMRASISVTRRSGSSRNERGKSFEETASDVIVAELVPRLAAKFGRGAEELVVLRNLKLGMASPKGSVGEIDAVIAAPIRCPERVAALSQKYKIQMGKKGQGREGGRFVHCLGVVEVKRNPDDLGEAFAAYQSSLGWLANTGAGTGAGTGTATGTATGTDPKVWSSYDPAEWVTKNYISGVFDRPYVVERERERGDGVVVGGTERLIFVSESFELLTQTDNPAVATATEAEVPPQLLETLGALPPRLFVNDLYFVTKEGCLELVSSKASQWALTKLGSSEVLGPGDRIILGVADAEGAVSARSSEEENEVERIRNECLERFAPRISSFDLCLLWRYLGLEAPLYLVSMRRAIE